MEFVTITSQGQITIPAKFRKKYRLDKNRKSIIREDQNKLVIEPAPDIMSLAGIFKDRAIKGKSIGEIIKIEEEAWGDAVSEDYRRKFLRKKWRKFY